MAHPPAVRVRMAAVAFLGALALSTSVHAAFPRLIMFSGGTLKNPLVMTDWYEVTAFLQGLPAPRVVPAETLSGRQFLQVTMFWGPSWKAHMDEGKPVSTLRPEHGNAHGRFYPATASAPAVFMHTSAPSRFDSPLPVPVDLNAFSEGYVLDANSMRLLERAGIPVSIVAR